jgi:hypothetical protein
MQKANRTPLIFNLLYSLELNHFNAKVSICRRKTNETFF